MIKLFLDDKRAAPPGFTRVKSVKACIRALEREAFDMVSLDYNLGRNRPKGYQVARYMVRQKKYPKTIIIHSNSPRGRLKMYRLLVRHKPGNVEVVIRPA